MRGLRASESYGVSIVLSEICLYMQEYRADLTL